MKTDLILLILAAAAVIWIVSSIAGAYTEKPLYSRVFMFITNELHFKIHPSTIQYRLITNYNLTPKQAEDCIENYAEGIDWFESYFKAK
jgi:hypothetical protein